MHANVCFADHWRNERLKSMGRLLWYRRRRQFVHDSVLDTSYTRKIVCITYRLAGSMSSIISTSEDSDTERGRYTPSSNGSEHSQLDQINDGNMADVTPGLSSHITTLQVSSTDNPLNGDIEMTAGPSMELDSGHGSNATVSGASCEEDKKISFPDGDLMLAVGRKHVKIFKTFSSLLASTSLIWNDLVVKAERESFSSLQLPNDDENSMLLFLQIAHLRFAELPRHISFEELYLLTRFCDKYQVRHLFLPFVTRWIMPFIRNDLDPANAEWLSISLVWEIEYILYPSLGHVFWNAKKDANGALSYAGHPLADLLPDGYRHGILLQVELARGHLLELLTECCTSALDNWSCRELGHQEECYMLTKGYLLTGFKDLGNWPPDPNTTHLCPEEIRSMILGLRYEPLPVANENMEDHSFCGVYRLKCQVSELNRFAGTDILILPNNSAIRSAFLPYSPLLCHSGFYWRDFEDIDPGSDDDTTYRQSHREDTEPLEEYLEESDPENYTYTGEDSSSGSDCDFDDGEEKEEEEDDL
ncbi:hypothetical protein NCU04436 [Paecilomyces variotii No. 5]|uniref:BTB domain-containing protein n=1 Tax=Byssochlamys spectabilis (strain No. 5 / NBRC 109023) TaxID=1356009 RepID=V5G6H8_BYSSN|nr:hypothetical protein NCU04436 [Paecilomyces variotii No. 5]